LDRVLKPGSYFLGVEGATKAAIGRFSLAWTAEDMAAQAAACASPPRLQNGRVVQGTTVGAVDRFATQCAGRESTLTGNDEVFRIDVAAPSMVKIALTAPTFNAVVALRRSCVDVPGVSGADQLACEDNRGRGRTATIDRQLAAGTYWIVVDGQTAADEGAFRLEFLLTPAK
jgi:hypothetical protein